MSGSEPEKYGLANVLRFKQDEQEEVPEPGEPGNEWLGVYRFVNGVKQFHAWSGAELNRIRRKGERAKAAEQRAGQRAFNRKKRKDEFRAGTRRAQLRILRDEVEVSPGLRQSLLSALHHQQRLFQRQGTDRAALLRQHAADRLDARRADRFAAGQPRGKDLRDDVFERYRHLLPAGYAGKRAADV